MAGRITALKIQKRNLNRINVFIDGVFNFGLYRITAAWLQVGQELSDQKIAELQKQDALEAAYQKTLNLLSYRQRSETELRERLDRNGIGEEVIENTLARLRRSGLVNDEKFARAWVENRCEFRPRSRRALTIEMRQRGLSHETIQQALEELPFDEEELAYQAAQKQLRKLSILEWPDFRKKLSGYLARRGFNYGTIQTVVKRVWKECQDGDNLKN